MRKCRNKYKSLFFLSLVSAYDRDIWKTIDEKRIRICWAYRATKRSLILIKILSLCTYEMRIERWYSKASWSWKVSICNTSEILLAQNSRTIAEEILRNKWGGSSEIFLEEEEEIKMTRLSKHIYPKISLDTSHVRSWFPKRTSLLHDGWDST